MHFLSYVIYELFNLLLSKRSAFNYSISYYNIFQKCWETKNYCNFLIMFILKTLNFFFKWEAERDKAKRQSMRAGKSKGVLLGTASLFTHLPWLGQAKAEAWSQGCEPSPTQVVAKTAFLSHKLLSPKSVLMGSWGQEPQHLRYGTQTP